MKQIRLVNLILLNFKGIKDLEIKFNGGPTNIFGANATGKTTINDAFKWLLFDKDSTDRSDFNIKTLDHFGNVVHGLEHTVTATLSVSGVEQTFSKTYKEIWRKKRGEAEKTFSGHETLYSIDDVPMQKKEYQQVIASIIDEQTFKMLTDPFYFAQVIPWKDRRSVLLDITGNIDDTEIVGKKPELSKLDLGGKTIEDFRKSVAAKRKKFNDELKAIPVRIDELNKAIHKEHNFEAIEEELNECEIDLKDIENQLNEPAPANPEIEKKRARIKELSKLMYDKEQEFEAEYRRGRTILNDTVDKLNDTVGTLERQIFQGTEKVMGVEREIKTINESMIKKRDAWNELHDKTFAPEVETKCPTCERSFDPEVIKQKKDILFTNFNNQKADALAKISAEGKALKADFQKAEAELSEIRETLESLDEQLQDAHTEKKKAEEALEEYEKQNISYPKEWDDLLEERNRLDAEIQELDKEPITKDPLIDRKNQLVKEIDELKSILRYREANEEHQARIKELMEEQKEIGQKVADIEKQEYLSEEFIKTKVELLETKINDKFSNVSFKLFDVQVNGAIDETCKVLIDGVPFEDANKAAKVNAGIDVINTLAEHYQVNAPIFIDNRESITNLIDTDSQVINLIVSDEHKTLKVA